MFLTSKLPALAVSTLLLASAASANCTVSVPFASGSSALTAQAQAYLQRIASTHSSNAMQLTGHTDAVGSAATNAALSQSRVQTVRNALSAGGVDSGAIVGTNAVGDANQRVQSAGAQAANRRVEIEIANCKPALFDTTSVASAAPGGGTAGLGAGGAGANMAGLIGVAVLGVLGATSTASGTN